MVEKVSLKDLEQETQAPWKTINLPRVNTTAPRFRVMDNKTTPWHSHEGSDQLLYVVSGQVSVETDDGSQDLNEQEFIVIPSRVKHRTRTNGRATLLIVDQVTDEQAQSLQPAG